MMSIRGHTVTMLLAFAALAVVWPVSLATDECGNEDTVECTTVGWFLLGAWMVLVVALARIVHEAVAAPMVGAAELSA